MRGMDVLALLKSASLLVPEETASENDVTVNDVWEYLARDEWETALGLLEELGDVRSLPAAFWASMAAAAEELRLERSAAWCHWREGRPCTVSSAPTSPCARRPTADAGHLSPAPASCARCGTSATAPPPANPRTPSPGSGWRTSPPWNPAAVLRCAWPLSPRSGGVTSAPVM